MVESMAEKLLDQLRQRKMTLGCAESCTGGLLSSAITDIPGCSDVFMLGHITYANRTKAEILDIDPARIAQEGAVSPFTALAMAQAAAQQAATPNATPALGLSTTGIAGPTTSLHKSVGLVFIAAHHSNHAQGQYRQYQFSGSRLSIRQQAVTAALEFALSHLEDTV